MGLTKPRASQIFDIDYKQATRVITVSDVTLAGGAPSQVDGVNLAEDDRVLVTGQSTASQNGLYFVSAVGTGADGTWLRTTDGNENGEVQAGMIVMVTEGSLYHDTQWKLTTNNPIVIGTTALTFVINILSQIGGSNTQIQYNNAGTMGGSANLTWDGTTLYTNGAVSVTGNITGNYILGNGSQLTGLPATYGNSNVATFMAAFGSNTISTTGSITSGNVTGGNILTGGIVSATGNITGGNITIPGTANISTFIGNVFFGSVPAQPTWYTIAPLNLNNSLVAATKVQLNLINTGGGANAGSAIDFYTYQISIAAANAEARIAAIDDGNYSAWISLQTKTPGSTGTNGLVERVKIDSTGASVVGNVTGGNLRTAGLISATGAITGAAITGSSLTVSTGNITVGNIVNANGNGVGNIGSATTYFNTVFAKATSAQYADLAENYEADADYAPGTVVVFGGDKEITISNKNHDTAVAGIISTNPSYLMNAGQTGEWVLPVALTGRVPCRVQGPVNKGTVLVTGDIPGTAIAIDTSKFEPGCVVGKSLEIINSTDVVTIEVAVGRL